jgi:hypothetical protein
VHNSCIYDDMVLLEIREEKDNENFEHNKSINNVNRESNSLKYDDSIEIAEVNSNNINPFYDPLNVGTLVKENMSLTKQTNVHEMNNNCCRVDSIFNETIYFNKNINNYIDHKVSNQSINHSFSGDFKQHYVHEENEDLLLKQYLNKYYNINFKLKQDTNDEQQQNINYRMMNYDRCSFEDGTLCIQTNINSNTKVNNNNIKSLFGFIDSNNSFENNDNCKNMNGCDNINETHILPVKVDKDCTINIPSILKPCSNLSSVHFNSIFSNSMYTVTSK